MEIKAKAKYIKQSPQKIRLVAKQIKNLPATEALTMCKFIKKRAAKPIAKLIASAIANAKKNNNLDEKKLKIKNFIINEGPRLKRWRAAARGVTHPYLRRTSHLEIILSDNQILRAETKAPLDKKAVRRKINKKG